MKQLQVKLEDNTMKEFKSKAAKDGVKMSDLIRGWIDHYLKSKEDKEGR